jgi:hypothetical protein
MQQSGTDAALARQCRHVHAGLDAFRNKGGLLRRRPAPPPHVAGDQLDPTILIGLVPMLMPVLMRIIAAIIHCPTK